MDTFLRELVRHGSLLQEDYEVLIDHTFSVGLQAYSGGKLVHQVL
jgi:hypothetical protein